MFPQVNLLLGETSNIENGVLIMEKLKFSVSICVYGGDNADYFDEALNSIFQQTRMPNEVVLVVDGPVSQGIENVISVYSSKYDILKVYRLEENQGHGKARNYNISNCSYDYIAIADADDINVLNRFEIQMEYFEKDPDLSAISSGCYHFIDSINNVISEEHLPEEDADIKQYMKTRCPLCQASTILKRSDMLKAGGYLDWYYAEDYYLWIRMFLCGAKFANTPQSLLYVRSEPSQMQRRGGLKYFKSLKRLYGYMYRKDIISVKDYLVNVISRFIVQVLMPSRLRAYVRRKFL